MNIFKEKLKIKQLLLFIFATLTITVGAQVNVNGTVKDDLGNPVEDAEVTLNETSSFTDASGNFTFENVSDGSYTITAEDYAIGKATQSITVAGQDVNLDLVIQSSSSSISLNDVIVTGSAKPKQKIESSVAVTTLNTADINEQAARGSADLLKVIPGFYVESSGGEAGNNVFSRGIPADGSFRYISLQEDGMPIIESPEMMFGNGDNYFRVDQTVKNLEGIRGGSASIFASNAPGGIINLVSNTGSYTKTKGIAAFTTSTYGTFRTDFNVGGPLAENWKYNIGGFYRIDDGLRNVGFTANQGGQIKMNLTRKLNNGFVRAYFKRLDDRNHFYLPIPVTVNGNDVGEIPGFDANYGTLSSPQLRYLSAPRPGGGREEQDLADGINPQVTSIGVELDLDLGNGWSLNEHLRRNVNDTRFNAIFSLNNPTTASNFVQSRYGLSLADVTFTYNDNGDAIPDNGLSALNGNGLIAEVGWWTVGLKTDDVSNKLQLTKNINDRVDLTFGHYYSQNNQAARWFWHNALVEIADKPRTLNIFDDTNNQALTENGYTRYGSNYLNYNFNTTVQAFYINSDIKLTDNFNADIGVRYELGDIDGYTEKTDTYDLGGNSAADDNVLYGTGAYDSWNFDYNELAWSIGLNYQFNKQNAAFARVADGFRAPDDNNLVFSNAVGAVVEDVFQAEAGYKYFGRNVGFFASVFYTQFDDIPFSDEVVDPVTGNITNTTQYASSNTYGLELESRVKLGNFGLNTTVTLQNLEYSDFTGTLGGTPFDFSGNTIRRIPSIYGLLTPYFQVDFNNDSFLKFMLPVQYIGKRYADAANTEENVLPAYAVWNSNVIYQVNKKFTVNLATNNIFNSLGLTEGNPRTGTIQGSNLGGVKQARPIFGTNATLTLSYSF